MSSLADRSTLSLIAQVLERKDRFRLGISLLLILIGTVLEMASLGLVIPVVQAVVSGDKRSEYEWLPEIIKELRYTTFVQLLMLAMVVLFLTKNIILLVSNYFQQRIQLSLGNRIIQRLFETYLRQPYEFHLVHSSSILVRNVQEYSSAVAGSGIRPLLTITTDVLTGFGLVTVLMLVQSTSTAILVSFFGLGGLVIVKLSRLRAKRWGAERIEHRGILMGALMGGFGGVKEIKLFGRDREVAETHRKSLHEAARASYFFSVLQSVPRAIFEVVAISGVALLIFISTVRNENLQDASLIIALFGVVSFRFLPAVNRVIQSVQELSFGRVALEGAVDGLSLPQQEVSTSRARPTDNFETLEMDNVTFSYPNTEALVTDVASLRITSGESVGIIGASGSGKSTLVDLLIGILAPRTGTITVNGRDISTDRRYWQDRIGYVPQHVYLMDTTVRRNVAFGLSEKEISNADVEKVLRLANL
ncbi:MAG: hypothetical protein RLZZ201_957, partial [Actinomycetota bacterium]